MKFISFLLILSLLTITSCGTKISEKVANSNTIRTSKSFDHLNHIRKESQKSPLYRKKLEKYRDSTEPKYFIDYVIKNILKKPEHKKYITDRRLLRKLKNNTCWESYVLIKDTLSNGNKCEIEIKTQDFDQKTHKLEYDKESNFLTLIDDKYPFGTIYAEYPTEEIKSLTIKINDEELNTDLKEYENLFNPNLCNFGMNVRIIEAYEDGDNLYIYIFGGDAADSYFAKLIFDKTGFITSIVTDYVPLSMYASFGKDFIGY